MKVTRAMTSQDRKSCFPYIVMGVGLTTPNAHYRVIGAGYEDEAKHPTYEAAYEVALVMKNLLISNRD